MHCTHANCGKLITEAVRPPATTATASESSFAGRGRAIDAADVEALRLDLAAWQGDLVGWLDAIGQPGRGTAPDR